jgi:hypothetical protein
MNPIINQMMGNMFANNPIMKLFQMVMGSKNQNTAMQNAAQQNPQLQQTIEYINKNGGNAKQLYYNMCQQKNTDPNIIINQLKQYM